ncbi:MAG TPA: GAF domain-containing sensor histidine kinase [Terriglobia bacterium]|nr:GAF domain-containing sensor histidine kinase [Terriglobia bacterium]
MEGSPVRGEYRKRDTHPVREGKIQIFRAELTRLLSSQLPNTEGFLALIDKSRGLHFPAWVRVHLDRRPALYEKLERGEVVGISHTEENPVPRPAASARSNVLLIPVIDDTVLYGVIGLVYPMDGPHLSHEGLETVRQFAQHAAPVLAREEEIEALLQEIKSLKSLIRMGAHSQSNLAHELRTPLAAVRGYARMILDGRAGEISNTQRDYLTVITENANRLIHLVSWMSHVAQQSAHNFKLSTFDLRNVWTDCVASQEAALRHKSINLVQHIPDESFAMIGDQEKMSYVLSYLIAIALRLNHSEGRITAEFSHGREQEVTIKITSDGEDIPSEMLGKIFERSVNAIPALPPQNADVSEFSLSGIYDVIGMHGGRVFVNSKPGAGATFLFTLPAVVIDGEEKSDHEQAVNSSRRRR